MKNGFFICLALCLGACTSNQPGGQGGDGTVPAAASNPIQLCRTNPLYLEYKGEPLALISSAEHYGAVLNLDFDYKVYLDYSFTAGNEKGDWPIPESNPGWGGPAFRKKLSILVETMKQVPFAEMNFTGSLFKSESSALKQYGLEKPGETYLVSSDEEEVLAIMLKRSDQ